MGYPQAMRMMLFVLLMLPGLLSAEVYKSVLPDGRVIYSDQPTEGATTLPITPAPAIKPVPVIPPNLVEPETVPQGESTPRPDYQGIIIIQPEEDATLRDNAGNLTLTVEVMPGLQVQAGHRLAVELDGVRLEGRFTGNRLHLSNVDRGRHSVVVSVVDADDKVLLRSSPRRIYLQRHSVLFP